jgi:hypothetical protein
MLGTELFNNTATTEINGRVDSLRWTRDTLYPLKLALFFFIASRVGHFWPIVPAPDPGSNPGRRGGKPATNRLTYGAA